MNNLRNKVNLIGRLGSKAEVQNVGAGFSLVKLALATSESYKDKSGEWKDNTQWHNLVAWGKVAENMAKTTDKGTEVVIEGRLVNKTYESKSGEKRYTTEIEVSDFLVLAPRVKNQEAAVASK